MLSPLNKKGAPRPFNSTSTAPESSCLLRQRHHAMCQPHHYDQPRRVHIAVPQAAAGIASMSGSDGGDGREALERQQHQASTSGSDPSTSSPREAGKPSLFDKIRAMAFFCWSLLLSIPLFITMLTMAPFVMLMDKYKRLAQHFVNQAWAKVSTSLFYPVEVIGRENLPPADKAVVYVANHQSFLDIYSLFHLDRPFKFISKTSNFLIPIVGWSMFLTGHVMINRTDRRSQLECLKACVSLLGKGAPVLFFPEGTRSRTRVMAGFKKGAFSVAGKAGVDVVPITLLGTGDLMPSGQEDSLRPGAVRIVVHKPIPTKGRDTGKVCDEARHAIASALPAELVGSPTMMAEGD